MDVVHVPHYPTEIVIFKVRVKFRVPKWVFGKLGQNWTIRIYTNAPNSNHNPYSMHSL